MQWKFLLIIFCLVSVISSGQELKSGTKFIFGKIETIILADENLPVDAKIDTGATMSSLSAKNITMLQKGEQTFVKFTLFLPTQNKEIVLIKPLVGFVKILKRREEEDTINTKQYAVRPIVKMAICMGNQKSIILVNLVDRRDFKYPLLLGSDAVKKFHALIDVNQSYTTPAHCVSDRSLDGWQAYVENDVIMVTVWVHLEQLIYLF